MSHVIGWAKTKELVNTGFFGWFFFGECNMYYFMLILVPIWPHSVFVINIKGGLVLSLTIDKVMCALLGLHKHKSQLFFKNSRAVFTRSVCNQNSCREIKNIFFSHPHYLHKYAYYKWLHNMWTYFNTRRPFAPHEHKLTKVVWRFNYFVKCNTCIHLFFSFFFHLKIFLGDRIDFPFGLCARECLAISNIFLKKKQHPPCPLPLF